MSTKLNKCTNTRLTAGFLGSMATLMLTSMASAPALAETELSGLYLNAHLGHGNSDTSLSELQDAANRASIPVTIESVDDNKNGFGLGLGYSLNDNWAVELNYLDMDQVDVRFSATQAIDNLSDIHPEAGEGISLSGLYKHPLDERAHLRARLGLFDWEAEYDTIAGPGGQYKKLDADGTDFYWGLGFAYELCDSLSFSTEYQQFEFDNDARQYLRAGIEWRFLD